MSRVALLGLSGSLRRASHATAILRTLAEAVAERATFTIFALHDVPMYNEDEDGPRLPPQVARLRAALAASQGLVVVSPEYNHGIPGVLKNAIDWASRPIATSALTGMPVQIMTSATSPLGGARAQAQLRETFAATQSRVMAHRQVVIGGVAAKIADGKLIDRPTLDFAVNAIDQLIAEIGLLELAASHSKRTS